MAQSTDPIGIFDSGVGGLSVAAAIRSLLPAEHLLYYADTAHFPYGSRSESEVAGLALAAAGFLVRRSAKLVVVACNTASSAALSTLRTSFDVPFVGVVPGVKPGALASSRAQVCVLATEATFQTKVFNDLVAEFGRGVNIRNQVCPELIALVEEGEVDSERVTALLEGYLHPLLEQGVDTLVLGCTHYHFLKDAVARVAGPRVTVIETAGPVARQVERVLEQQGLRNPNAPDGGISFFSSGDLRQFLRSVEQLWPESIGVKL